MKSTFESSSDQKSTSKTDMAGGLQEMILRQVTELGDLLERAGEKTEQIGFEKVGEALYQLGNKIEHIRDRFDSKDSSQASSRASNRQKSDRASGTEQYSGASVTSAEGLRANKANQKSDSTPVIER